MSLRRTTFCLLLCLSSFAGAVGASSDEPSPDVLKFLKSNCYDCHHGEDSEAGFDLEKLPTQFDATDVEKWVRIFDRVRDHEMPPTDYGEIEPKARQRFLKSTGTWLKSEQERSFRTDGRVRGKRLTNLQLEKTLHDLLGIDIPLAVRMPEEPRVNGFTTVANGQPMSHFQLEQHLDVVDAALDESYRRATNSLNDGWSQILNAKQLARRNARRRVREPELLEGLAVTWSSGLVFYGRLPATTAQQSGWYRMTVRAKALKPPRSGTVWCTIRTGKCVSTAPLMDWAGAFEATEELSEHTVIKWLPAEHMFEIRPGDDILRKANFRGGQVGSGEGEPQNVPGVAIESIKLERIHLGPPNGQVRELMFGNLEINRKSKSEFKLVSKRPRSDAARLMKKFATRAFRRPVENGTLQPYLDLVNQLLDDDQPLHLALRSGYRALLCSPRFLYMTEQPGKLDDYAIASRLSYFLWNRMPDNQLLQLAASEKLHEPEVLRREVERLLNDSKADVFVKDLSAQWLDLSLIDFTEPDRKLYPGFDSIVQNSMLKETNTFLQTMLKDDRSVGELIDSDYTYLNSRLARFYGIPNVKGDELRKVKLEPKHNRGGLMTQGAILKVTANGTTTSPVIRGVWISERLLGEEIPPPPANISAIEPDIRGAKTIREQLAKHKNDASCASCHVKMDPPGFALENYDPSGRWRDSYLKFKGRRRIPGTKIDASSELIGGKPFKNIREFQSLILQNKEIVAANVVEKLLTYSTGAPIAFADRETVENCVKATKESDYGFRSLIHAVVQSDVFLSK